MFFQGVEGYAIPLAPFHYSLGILIFLGLVKVALDLWRNTLLMTNQEAVAVIATAVSDAANAIKDLAAKVAAGQDVSEQLTTIAGGLEDVVKSAGEPVTQA